jgi:hypothetical protein
MFGDHSIAIIIVLKKSLGELSSNLIKECDETIIFCVILALFR